MCMFENMSEREKDENEIFANQLRELMMYFNQIDSLDVAGKVIEMVKKVAMESVDCDMKSCDEEVVIGKNKK